MLKKTKKIKIVEVEIYYPLFLWNFFSKSFSKSDFLLQSKLLGEGFFQIARFYTI